MRRLIFALVVPLITAACGGSTPATSTDAASPPAGQPQATTAGTAGTNNPAGGSAEPAVAAPVAQPDSTTSAQPPAPPAPPAESGSQTLTAAAGSATPAAGSMSVSTKAVEVRVEGVTVAAEIGGRQARAGYEFVIVSTSWKNLIPLTAVDKNASSSPTGGLSGFGTTKRPPPDPKDIEMKPTPYVIPSLRKHMWLFTDDRFADTVDLEAQAATPEALADGFGIPTLDAVVRGKMVFEAPAGAHYRAFQFYDNTYGHVLIPLGGTKPGPAPAVGAPRQNTRVQLTVSQAGFVQASEIPAGQRLYVVGLRGIGRAPRDVVELEFDKYVWAQTDSGCVFPPANLTAGMSRPLGDRAFFPPTAPNEGQIGFLVPEGTKNVRVLVTPAQVGTITLPTAAEFTPSWPTPQATIDDGTTMKVHVLPVQPKPGALPAAGPEREYVVFDVVLESLKPNQGIDFQTTQQLRLVNPAGGFIEPSALSNQLACHLGDEGIVPAGHARRFTLVYDVPAGMPLKLQYRGFEKDQVLVDLKR